MKNILKRIRDNRIRRYWLQRDISRIMAGFTDEELALLRDGDYLVGGRPKDV